MTNRTLGEHLRDAHGTAPALLDAISDNGARFLHDGAHTVRKGDKVYPDGVSSRHIATGREDRS